MPRSRWSTCHIAVPPHHGYELVRLLGRSRIPDAVSERWQAVIGAALKTDFVRERFARIGVTPGNLDRTGYTALVREELDRWRPVIAAARISAD